MTFPEIPAPPPGEENSHAMSSLSSFSGEELSSPNNRLEDAPLPVESVEAAYDSGPPAGEPTATLGREESDADSAVTTAVARYGAMGFLGEFRYSPRLNVRPLQKVVLRTDRGVELGEVLVLIDRSLSGGDSCAAGCPTGRRISPETLATFLKASSENYPFQRGGRILRIANSQDLIDSRHLAASAREESRYCREQIRRRNLPMRLVTAEHLLGGERIVFYFTSETRVDFRALVRDLATQFRTRIEMRQVGARDEARLVADYERCGQPCCCREFLKELKPVSMRMAKVQKATLDPTKISGRCGRLMCCLRYEDECYEELKKHLPRRNSWVRTKQYIGQVVDGQILTQLVRLALYDGTFVVVPVEEILQRDLEPPPEEELRAYAARQAAAQRAEARRVAEQETYLPPALPAPQEADEEEESAPEGVQEEPPSAAAASGLSDESSVSVSGEEKGPKRRRRRRKSRSGSPTEKQPGDSSPLPGQPRSGAPSQPPNPNRPGTAGTPSPPAGGGASSSRRRRNRRRRKRPGGGEGTPPAASPPPGT